MKVPAASTAFNSFNFINLFNPPNSTDLDPDDRPLRLAASDLLEAGLVVHGLRPKPHVLVLGTSRFVHRVGLNQRGSLFPGVGDGCLEERPRHTLPAVLGRHDKANY